MCVSELKFQQLSCLVRLCTCKIVGENQVQILLTPIVYINGEAPHESNGDKGDFKLLKNSTL